MNAKRITDVTFCCSSQMKLHASICRHAKILLIYIQLILVAALGQTQINDDLIT
jgi:hypothetical protein